MKMVRRITPLTVLFVCAQLAFGLVFSGASQGARAQSAAGTIAYVPADTRDSIRLIEPDGSGDRLLWSTGLADPHEVYDIWSLKWRPDSSELVFASTHEGWCSINNADIFTVRADGSGYRRVTEAPSCAALAGFPKGVVQVPVTNTGWDAFTGFVYFQGAPSALQVSLPAGGSTTLTFQGVADFGDGALQVAGFMEGPHREINAGAAADVLPGQTVQTEALPVFPTSDYSVWEVHSPTWRYDGSKIAYVLNFNSIKTLSPNPPPLDFGQNALTVPSSGMPDFASHLAYGPTAATASQLLYAGSDAFDTVSVYRVTEGSATPGEKLVTHDFIESILGLAWLPDGSGFVYSKKETTYSPGSANLYLYVFATKSTTKLTQFGEEFAGLMSVSPDGQQILFERGSSLNLSLEIENPDLWIVNRDGSGLKLFRQNARTPAWSPGELSLLAPAIYLPLVVDR